LERLIFREDSGGGSKAHEKVGGFVELLDILGVIVSGLL
jgi:hypothetical protein